MPVPTGAALHQLSSVRPAGRVLGSASLSTDADERDIVL